MQHGKKHSNFRGTDIIRLMTLVIPGTEVVWYKIRAWKARTSGILNSIWGLTKPLEYMSVNRKFSVKRLISHTSNMKGTNRDILCSYILNILQDLTAMALESREDIVGDKAEKKGTRDKNYWLKRRLWQKNFWCSSAYGIYEFFPFFREKSQGCPIGV